MAVATLGAFVVVAGVLGLVSLYLGAVTQALAEVPRSSPLPDYPGRPDATAAPDTATPMRYLVLVTDEDGALASAYLAQMSAQRDALQLIGMPANLLVTDPDGTEMALAGRFSAAGAAGAVRSLESMLGLRIDHLVELKLNGFLSIIDVLGGVDVRTLHTPGHAPGACCFYVPDLAAVFSGDTLFSGGPGATGRSFSDFDLIIDSISEKLLTLPSETLVLTGHGDSTTIGVEAPQRQEWIDRGH